MQKSNFLRNLVWVLVAVGIFSFGIGYGVNSMPKADENSETSTPLAETVVPTETLVPTIAATNTLPPTATSTPTATLQPTQELQVPWTPVNFTPIATQSVSWDHLVLIGDWLKAPGLAPNVEVLYLQSGTQNKLDLAGFTVPAGQHLIFGAFAATLSIEENGITYNYGHSNGFYAAVPGGTMVTDLFLTDGFALLVKDSDALSEFCFRVAQAYAEEWAYQFVYHSPSWSAPVCEGIYSVPLDSDR